MGNRKQKILIQPNSASFCELVAPCGCAWNCAKVKICESERLATRTLAVKNSCVSITPTLPCARGRGIPFISARSVPAAVFFLSLNCGRLDTRLTQKQNQRTIRTCGGPDKKKGGELSSDDENFHPSPSRAHVQGGEGSLASALVSFYSKVSKVCSGRQNFTGQIIADYQEGRVDDLYKTHSIFPLLQNALDHCYLTLIGGHPLIPLLTCPAFRKAHAQPLCGITKGVFSQVPSFAPFANQWKFLGAICLSRKLFRNCFLGGVKGYILLA